MSILTTPQILDAGLEDWRPLAQALHTRFLTRDFTTGLALVSAIGALAEEAGHHPDLTLTYPHVDVKLMSHDSSGITERDTDLAHRISALAHERGILADASAPTVLELALDTADSAGIGPFWAALLTGDPGALHGDDVVDPTGRVPLLWFQHTDAHATPRQRFHLDVWVPHDVAGARIDAAVAAGGTVVDDAGAPSFTVLADTDGNRACVCTALGR
ncbi:4a-hydroxytetrahydrobiopterin dehydratase [Arthrobacter agilis]|uniref:4a-hydroxytetrahydrobiopterin dehydratase n=1 Tax=Arthrobacter agilis TaxID=37921 RepID=UPI000B35BBC1|nr:4a-hydroxytetrahydrobiopterin dehydratase [Arthrobacter agilis]OUM43109.1 4a-hydroxytetrahydrobiopterin dehydratase [Arthrobacter agilis]PPB46054.1 4a-hydroxytetrahydrobiopterin dehydratase [Arthrobacter agilis]TPV25596.1 4a-hydroxytetrahydrobiopterin dehydratase [Arthrobacter agilis]VDR33364.1 Putative pterin-4-alpha-carbinolamine dehydratase [Arthrobacter agilis]